MNDSLGDRMKRQYENRTRYELPRRTYTVIRCDGKAFHTFTRSFAKPYSNALADAMHSATYALCKGVQGAIVGYTQSDEISVIATDFSDITTEAWFDGNLQKVISVAASIVTAAFNARITRLSNCGPTALFDARAFTIPDPTEVENYLIWRQQDATRNSIQGLAQAHFSHKQLHGVTNPQAQDMLFKEKGINWNDLPVPQKRGVCLVKDSDGVWFVDDQIPVFTQDRDYLRLRIPVYESQHDRNAMTTSAIANTAAT